MVEIYLVSFETAKSSEVAVSFCIPTSNERDSYYSKSLPEFGAVSVLKFVHSNRWVVITHCCFNLHFPNNIHGETVETVSDFIFWGSKITADGDCSHEIKRCLLLGRKVMTNLDSILKSRNITLPTKVYLAKAIVFPVVMCGCESWTMKKADHRKIDAFKLWCGI